MERSWTLELILEPLARAHAAALLPQLQDSAIYAFMPGAPVADLRALEVELERLAAGCPRPDELWLNWVALQRGEPVATLQATVYRDQRATIGYTVFPTHWNRGVGTAGVRLLLDELFTNRQVRVVQAFVDRRNERSLRLLRRLRLRQLSPEQQPEDTPATDWVFEVTQEEWLRREPAGAA